MAYVPNRGDLVWTNFDPQSGHEQAGKRPAIVLSPAAYNHKTGLAIFCPITSQVKGYGFEVVLPPGGKISGAVLCDQVKSMDWKSRKAKLIERLPAAVTDIVLAKLKPLLWPSAS